MKILKKMKIFLVTFLVLISTTLFSQETIKNYSFSNIKEIKLFIGEDNYKDLIRESLFKQPEFQYIMSMSKEQEFNLKLAKRNRFPTISGNIINDESIERNITDNNSVRKRRDDSFDANIEIKQAIYSGGQVSSVIRSAKSKAEGLSSEKMRTVSQLILEANQIYLDTLISNFILNYAEDLMQFLKPYRSKVDDRVNAGIMDPVDSALFYVRYSSLETLIYKFKSQVEKNNNEYSNFYKQEFNNFEFPSINIKEINYIRNNDSYDVEISKSKYDEKKAEISTVRSEYLPKFGISARYTKYDIDDDTNEDDIRGGLYLSMPIFSFGRGAAKINAAKAAASGYKSDINVKIKEDIITESSLLSDFRNSLSNRFIFLKSFQETVNQRKTLQDRIELSGFAINALTEVLSSEISQLQTLLENEAGIMYTYFSILHQNRILNNEFNIKVD